MIYFSLAILIFALGAQLWLRFFVNKTQINADSNADKRRFIRSLVVSRLLFVGATILIFFLLSYQSYQQYQVWSQNEVSKFLLPPYQSIFYFIFYIAVRFFAPYLISLAAALLFLLSAKTLNKKYEERFFYPEEPYLGALAIFLLAHPGWLFYAVSFIFCYLIVQFIYICVNPRANQRISAYWLWLPAAIFVILIGKWLRVLPIWQILKI